MNENTEEFLARFRATGLDMLCEARRREEQFRPWVHTTVTRRLRSHPVEYTPNLKGGFFRSVNGEYVDGDGPKHTIWKSHSVGASYFPRDEFFGIDFDRLEKILLAQTPNREPVIIRDRRVVFDLEALRTGFSNINYAANSARKSMDEWVASFGIWDSKLTPLDFRSITPKGRSLGPGKEVEQPNEMRPNRKRIEKERKRKKQAKRNGRS